MASVLRQTTDVILPRAGVLDVEAVSRSPAWRLWHCVDLLWQGMAVAYPVRGFCVSFALREIAGTKDDEHRRK